MEPRNSVLRGASSFVGRERERRAVAELLRQSRLLTLTGPGGAGKTRLAMEVAADLAGDFTAGVAVVPLAGVQRADAVLPAIALALGLRDQGARSPHENLVRSLARRELLLVLDNFEQVAAAAPQIAALLAATTGPRLLVTSRGALHISGEQEFPVAPLALPPEDTGAHDSPAVRLFVDRARAVRPDFALSAENAAAVAAICRRLDGLPLAIELAAARIRLLAPGALLARLGRPLAILTGGPRDQPARHQTLRDAIAWSYDLLEGDEQRLLRRLAVFAGSFSLAAVEAVCADQDEPRPAFDRLAALADQSLIAALASEDEPRFTMLETIREYAADMLEASGELAAMRRAHSLYYVQLAEEAAQALAVGDARAWAARLDADQGNVGAALSALMNPAEGDDPEPALRLTAALAPYWWGRGRLREGYAWLQAAIARSSGGLPIAELRSATRDRSTDALLRSRLALRVDVLISAGEFVRDLDGPMAAAAFHESALGLARELGDQAAAARALGGLGAAAFARGDYQTAAARIEESLALYSALEQPWRRAVALNDLSFAVYWLGQFDRARALSGESLALMSRLGDPRGAGYALLGLGATALQQGDPAAARANYEAALAKLRAVGDARGVGLALTDLAQAALAGADLAGARAALDEALATLAAIGDSWISGFALVYRGDLERAAGSPAAAAQAFAAALAPRAGGRDRSQTVQALEGMAGAAAALGHFERAAALFSAAETARAALALPPLPTRRARTEADMASTRHHLSAQAFARALAEGRALSLAQAVELALRPSGPAAPPPASAPDSAAPDELTAREREVLRHVAAGLSNQAIAEALSVSIYTVQAHLRSVYAKLGVSTRAAAGRYAWAHGLAGQ